MIITDSWNTENITKLETLYHNANGYIGIRNSPEQGMCPGSIRGTYINGIHEIMTITYGEKLYGFPETKQTLANVPDAQTMEIHAGTVAYSMFSEDVTERVQLIDLRKGISRRESVWHTSGGDLSVCFERIASFDLPNLFLMRATVHSDSYSGPVTLRSKLVDDVRNHADANDPRVAAEPLRCFDRTGAGIQDGIAWTVLDTRHSHQQICACVAHQASSNGELGEWMLQEQGFVCDCTGMLNPGEKLVLDKYVIYTDSVHTDIPKELAIQLIREALSCSAEIWFRKQADFVSRLAEKTYVRLEASEMLEQAMEYDLFELIQSTGRDGLTNVAAKGLSGAGYEGHTFWDSEIYVLPYFLWTQPDVARDMLTWRYRMLPQARENARVLGMKTGALFPWRTINGDECSAFFPAGTAQYHIDGDIAYAFLQYYFITGDIAFMAEMGAEVLIETARMWMELGTMWGGEFRINCVTGPDEYTCCVNNNFYTNAVAQYNLYGAVTVMKELREKGLADQVEQKTGITQMELDAFHDAAMMMYLPYNEELDISEQDDSFLSKKKFDFKSLPKSDFPLLLHYHPLFLYRHQVCKQADTVLAHLLFPETVERSTIQHSFDYYDAVTTHDSSLSVCVFATVAARLGLMERAEQGFADTATLDLFDTHGNTRDGLHTASLGGAYLAMLMGFAGVHVSECGLRIEPVLPKGFKSYEIPLRYQGGELLLRVDEKGSQLSRLSGEKVSLIFNGYEMTV